MEYYDYIWFCLGRLFLVYLGVSFALVCCGFIYDLTRNRQNCFRVFMAIKFGFAASLIAMGKVRCAVVLFFKDHGRKR